MSNPTWQSEDGSVQLYLGDCLEVLPTLGKVDAVVTSPPYDNLRKYGGYSFDFEPTARALKSRVADGGVVVWIVNDETKDGSESGTSFRQALGFMDAGFRLHDTMIWNKGVCRYPEVNRYYPTFEYMFVVSNGKPKTTNLIADRKNKHVNSKVARRRTIRTFDGRIIENSAYRIDRDRRIKETGVRFNVWNIPVSAATDERSEHPATFPIAIARDHVLSWTNECDTVLDCFMGSGTTGVACVRTGRKFIGIEISEQYFEIAKTRIQKAIIEKSEQLIPAVAV